MRFLLSIFCVLLCVGAPAQPLTLNDPALIVPQAAAVASDFPTDSLVGYWKLDEASGTRADSSGSGQNLTDNNTVTNATGVVGSAAWFVSTNSEYLSVGDSAALSMGDIDFTIAFWVKLINKDAPDRVFISKYNPTANTREYSVGYVATAEQFRLLVSADGTTPVSVQASTFGAPAIGTFYFVVASHNATSNIISIAVNNGTANTTSHTTGVLDSTSDFNIGRFASDSGYCDAVIDEVGIWKRILTAAEITYLYNSGNGRTLP
jgi:hypothetical protein